MRLISFALALGLAAPVRAAVRTPPHRGAGPQPKPRRAQPRRRGDRKPALTRVLLDSPCGRHQVIVERGEVFVDGQRVHAEGDPADALSTPAWRHDGSALAWLERRRGETRLVVLPSLGESPLAWALPRTLGQERVHWADDNRVVVGPALLQPLAIASW